MIFSRKEEFQEGILVFLTELKNLEKLEKHKEKRVWSTFLYAERDILIL